MNRKAMGTVVAIFWMAAGPAFAGGNEVAAEGGDLYAQEFTAIGRSLVERFREHPDPRIADLDALEEAVKSATVATKDRVEFEGAEVDAVDYPEKKLVELNRKRWAEYDKEKKSALVLHEYLGLSRADDSHYQISHAFSDLAIAQPARRKLDFETHIGFGRPLSSYGHEKYWGFSVGYQFDPHWELGVGYDSAIIPAMWGPSRESKYSLFGKYNFSRWGKFQPYAKLGVTYSTAIDAWGLEDGSYYISNYTGIGATAALGGTYWLTSGFGLDLSATGDKPRIDRNYFSYAVQTGVRLQF
jgi:hypothetical protein